MRNRQSEETCNCFSGMSAWIEAGSIRIYEDMANKEDNPDALRLVLKIVEEGKRQDNIMDNLCNFFLAP